MAIYTGAQLSGAGILMEGLNAGVTYDFVLLRPISLSGSGYITMETVRDAQGFYDSTRPTNAIGVYDFTTETDSVVGAVSSSYIMSGVVSPTPDNTSSFTFTPTADIAARSSFLRTTGGIGAEVYGNFAFATKADLQTAVNLWISNETLAIATYGQINTWDVSAITDMSALFISKTTFNSDISNWDVSGVTNMDSMFSVATSFDQDISAWDVSSVTSMGEMFQRANAFNQNISSWGVSSVTSMGEMFSNATSFNQPLNNWDVSNVANMEFMFANANSFQQPLNLWEVNALTFADGFMGVTGGSSAITYTGLDTLYNGWVIDIAAMQSGVTISFGNSTFTSAGLAAKNILTGAPLNWTITDGGQV